MPKESFDGIILGGFYVQEINKEDKKKENNKVQIKNEFSYVIGVKLTGTDEVVKPKLKLNEVQAGLMNYRTVVTANLQNTEAVIINNLDVNARITKEGKKRSSTQRRKVSYPWHRILILTFLLPGIIKSWNQVNTIYI